MALMRWLSGSQNITFEVRALENVLELFANILGGDINLLLIEIGNVEENLIEERLQDRVNPARTDVLHLTVDQTRDLGHLENRIGGESEQHPITLE